jgi:hypothetical protein
MNAGKHKQTDPLEQRKKVSFEQAEGIEPMPSQLAQGEISQESRAVLWNDLHHRFEDHRESITGTLCVGDPWGAILRDVHVYRDHRPIDDFPTGYYDPVDAVKKIIFHGEWSEVLGWLEFVLKRRSCPDDFAAVVDGIMRYCRLAYGVFDGVVICPIGSDADRATIEGAFADLAATKFHGARAHLRMAAEELTAGHYPDSVRESIHAVEAIARILGPSTALSTALHRLEKSVNIHPALKQGFNKLYGYTSDERGIRHALLDDGTAKVDDTDALFMIGACAAFVSYLINKARSAGI